METSQPLLIGITEAATLLGISPYTLRTWLRRRQLPCVRLGRRVLIEAQELARFVAANRVAARDEG